MPRINERSSKSASVLDDERFGLPPESSEDEVETNDILKLDLPASSPESNSSRKRHNVSSLAGQRSTKRSKLDLVSPDNESEDDKYEILPRRRRDATTRSKASTTSSAPAAPVSKPAQAYLPHDALFARSSQPSQRRRKVYQSQAKKAALTLDFHSAHSPEPEIAIDAAQADLASPEPDRGTPVAEPQTEHMKDNGRGSPEPTIQSNLDFCVEDDTVQDSTTLTTSHSGSYNSRTIFDRRNSNDSVSSLSSADSLAEMMLSPGRKEALSSENVLCPICNAILAEVSAQRIQPSTSALRGAAAKQFCHAHEIDDAKLQCDEKGFPQELAPLLQSERIQRHIADLRSIIERKEYSYYLQQLDDAVSEAKGNMTKINYYISQTAVENVHYGYYGPSGSTTLTAEIRSDPQIEKALNRARKKDKSMRSAAGNIRIVSAVLLPELLTSLVTEDMKLGKAKSKKKNVDEEARKILRESANAGFLLHPDPTTLPQVVDS